VCQFVFCLEAQNKQKKVEIKKKKKKNKKIQNKKKRMLSFDQSDGEEEQIINPRPKKKRKSNSLVCISYEDYPLPHFWPSGNEPKSRKLVRRAPCAEQN
jgi:hypothetical protein